MYRTSDFLQALQDIRNFIESDSDSVALAFALEYAAQMVKKVDNANNGKRAQIFFCRNNNPRDRGWIMKKHPYNISLGNKFRKAGRKMKAGTKGIFRKQKPSIHVEPHKEAPPPAPQPAAEQPKHPETQHPAPSPAADAGDGAHQGIGSDLQPMKPLTLKPRKGGADGFRL